MSAFCNENTPAFIQQECGVERAGIVATMLVDVTVGDPTDLQLKSVAYWNALMHTSPPLAYRIMKVRGEYPKPSVTSEEGFGRESKQNTSADHEINWEVEGILSNRDFFESVNKKKWKEFFVTAADLGYWVNDPVTVDARFNNPKDIKASAFWSVNSSWVAFKNPRVVDLSGVSTFQE